MTQQHPITPPPDELVRQWLGNFFGCTVTGELSGSERYLATQAARWGADQELEACCEWAAEQDRGFDDELRAARRPKPPSLKELALKVLPAQTPGPSTTVTLHPDDIALVRRALEELPDD